MNVCIDTNVLISYLLNPSSTRPPTLVVHAFFQGRFDLVLSETILLELSRKVGSKSYLRAHISEADVSSFVALLRKTVTVAPEIPEPIPAIVRDVNDDFLIAHAVVEGVDLLISGDKDLLALGTVGDVRIVSPATFVRLLDAGLE